MNSPTQATPIARYFDLQGRVVFLSGGATGIGQEMVRAFAQQEAVVVFADIDKDAGTALAAETGAQFIDCDVTDDAALFAAIEQAESLGGIDVLINNAANDQRLELDQVDAADWTRLIDVNLRHQFFAAQKVAEKMATRQRGSIINLGSVAPQIRVPNLAIYSACKAAVRGLTRSLAADLGGNGIRVNSILPGAVLTEKQRSLWYPDQASIDAMVTRQCLAREMAGDDIAQMALFLASDVSAACTGQEFIVDAGIS